MTYQTKHPPRLRFISAVLSLAMLLTLLPVTAFAAIVTKKEIDGLKYVQVDNYRVLWITGTYTGTATHLTLENSIGGLPVNRIYGYEGDALFKNNQTLKSVTLPTNDYFYEIGDEAFAGCINLETVVAPATLGDVGKRAFQGCTALKSLALGRNSSHIYESAFEGCTSLKSIEITGTMVYIENTAFKGCTDLTRVTLPKYLEKMGNNVFEDCTNLEEITLPKEIREFGDNVFAGCTKLKKIIYNGKSTDWANCPAKEKIPENVTVEFAVPLTEYGISVCGIKANEANYADMLGDKKVEFVPTSNYLILDNANVNYDNATTAAIDSTLDSLVIAGRGNDVIENTSGPGIRTTGKLDILSTHIVVKGKPAISAKSIVVYGDDYWYRTAANGTFVKYTESVAIGDATYFELIESKYNPNEPNGIFLWINDKRMPEIYEWESYDVFGNGTALLEEKVDDLSGGMHCTLYLKDANLESADTAIQTMVEQLTIIGIGTIKGGKNSLLAEINRENYYYPDAKVRIEDSNLTFTGGLDLHDGAEIVNSTVTVNDWSKYGIEASSELIIDGSNVTIASETGEHALCPWGVKVKENSTLRLQGAKSVVIGGDKKCTVDAENYWYRTSPDDEFTKGTEKEFQLDKNYTYYELTTIDPDAVTYNLWVAGKQVTETNQNDVLEDGTARYDPDTHTLTLDNANLYGDNKYYTAIRYTGFEPLTVTGSAILYGAVGIHADDSELNIENAELTFLTETTVETVGDADMSIGFTGRNGMTIRNSTLKIGSAFASGQGACAYPYISNGDILIQNSNISLDDDVRCEYGLSSDTSLTIDNSEVTIQNANVVAAVGGKKLTISGTDTWIDTAINTDESKYAPIWCKNGIDLQDGLEVLENTAENGVTRMVIGNRANQVFTVTFEMNGHGKQELTQKVKNGAPPTIPAYPDAEGWYFAGWYADPECTEAADFDLPIQKDTTFYAKWDKMHTIHFELNGHGNEGYYNDWEIRDGSALGELGSAWDDEWYFAGWFTDPELTTKVNPETIVTGDITCYAKWLKPEGITQYKVRFDLNASDAQWDWDFNDWGEWDDAHRVITAETYFDCYDNENEQFVQSVRMEIYAQPERGGYTFKGWYTAPEGGEKMEEKYDVSDVSMGVIGYIAYITEDLTFYAQWEKIGGEPSNPDKPTEPEQPEQPTEPSNPEKPTEPENPEQPSTPEQPENPDKPTEPEQPTTPTEPSEPEQPSQPEKPSEPEQPSKPSEPEKPEQPENPEKPSESEQPTTPSDPGNDGGGAGAAILLAGGAVVIGAGVATVGVAAYGIGTELAAWLMLPAGAGMPTTRGELAVVLWKQAGCPAVPMEAPLSETEIALRWAIDHQLADEDAAPEESVSTAEVFKALKKAKDI